MKPIQVLYSSTNPVTPILSRMSLGPNNKQPEVIIEITNKYLGESFSQLINLIGTKVKYPPF